MKPKPLATAYLTVDQVAERYNTSKASIWRWTKTNASFPQPIKIGPNCTRWSLEDLLAHEAHLKAVCLTTFATPV